MYQSAFCAGFMDQGLPSKRAHHARFAAAAFDSPCARRARTQPASAIAENSSKARCWQHVPNRAYWMRIRSDGSTSSPTTRLQEPSAKHVREDDNARPCLQADAKKIALDCARRAARTRDRTAQAQKKYDPGATDTEIKIGNIMPYSGPASAYATIGKTEAAYFNKLNSEGGINGRKINFISYDDGYSPPKAVEQARKLVESDEVLLIFNPLGTPSQQRDPEIHERQEGAAAVRLDGRGEMERPEELSVDHGLAAELPDRGAHLCRLYPEESSGQDHRHPLPERRFRQRLRDRAARRPRRSGQQADPDRVVLRDLGADGGFAGGADQGRQSRHLRQHRDAEIRGAGDQEDRAS